MNLHAIPNPFGCLHLPQSSCSLLNSKPVHADFSMHLLMVKVLHTTTCHPNTIQHVYLFCHRHEHRFFLAEGTNSPTEATSQNQESTEAEADGKAENKE